MLEIGCCATQMLLDLLEEKSVENRVLSPFLLEGGSSCTVKSITRLV